MLARSHHPKRYVRNLLDAYAGAVALSHYQRLSFLDFFVWKRLNGHLLLLRVVASEPLCPLRQAVNAQWRVALLGVFAVAE